MTVVGVLILTPDALFLRLVEVGHWSIVFWRGLFAGFAFVALNALVRKESLVGTISGLRGPGLVCAVLFAASNCCFVLAITHTTVANTLVVLAAMPFIAAVLGLLFLRAHLPARTWISIFLAMAGIVIVFWGRLGSGSLFGDICALSTAFLMASVFLIINRHPHVNALAAIGLGSFIAAIIALAAGANPDQASARDFVYLVVNGGVIIPAAMGLITYGPKLISAPEVGLIMLLETVLGPLWIWLGINERPPPETFIGGCLVVTAVLANAWFGFRSKAPRAAKTAD